MKQTNKKIVALYKGEEFIDAGTYKEIATHCSMLIKTIASTIFILAIIQQLQLMN